MKDILNHDDVLESEADVVRFATHVISVAIGVVLLFGFGLAVPAQAQGVPDPPFTSVDPADSLDGLVLCPTEPSPIPTSIQTITVRNSSNIPIQFAEVRVVLTVRNPVCGGTSITGTTDENGQVTLILGGGGCAAGIPLSGVIKVNGITIRAYENVKSPDRNGDLRVDLGDLVSFSSEFLAPDGACHDYNNDGVTGLPDLIIFAPAFTGGNHCSP